jgi:hypothetical protein
LTAFYVGWGLFAVVSIFSIARNWRATVLARQSAVASAEEALGSMAFAVRQMRRTERAWADANQEWARAARINELLLRAIDDVRRHGRVLPETDALIRETAQLEGRTVALVSRGGDA